MKQVFARPLLFGHRGSSVDHIENTLPSFADCLEHHIDGIELDVQRCKSGELVVIHDYDLKRVAGHPGKVAELTYQELKEIDIGNGEQVPLLTDVFALGGTNLYYDIEIKAPGTKNLGVEQLLLEQIRQSGLESRCLVSSFNPISLLRFKRKSKGSIPTGLIYGDESGVPRILRHGFGRHITHPSYLKPSKEQVMEAKSFTYQLCAWTVDDREEAKSLLAQGVMGIISNNPKALKGLFTV
ncbi:glycerophosphodiester phosphodiesterase family protein [uncultured Sphaerochaeta sp.]|uniref:glycerophosphodiester phosphodiesterase n=1 Tax=uncultured Sphaerochaeta sp. TaxID=886478 RepID=UPI0029CA22E2|nr:glycerophosphodiester phosphodiesterase family protein [uncultured Sphaerochaeta sp.]